MNNIGFFRPFFSRENFPEVEFVTYMARLLGYEQLYEDSILDEELFALHNIYGKN